MTEATPEVAPAKRVAASEAELLTLTRGLVGGHRGRFIPLLRRRRGPITAIGPTAMGLLQQTLARGVTSYLLRAGGWQRRASLRGDSGEPVRGRLWQRHDPLPPLRFTPASFELLTWLHSEDVAGPKRALEAPDAMTVADELLHYLALSHVVRAVGQTEQPGFQRSALCQLGFADQLGGAPELAFDHLCVGPGAAILEAMQPELARRWVAMEAHKGQIVSLEAMLRACAAQDLALRGLFTAIDRSGSGSAVAPRRDLAGFFGEAAVAILARGPEGRCPDHRWWTRSLDLRAPLSTRQRAFSAAAVFLRAVGRLGDWLAEAGIVAHFDEDYEAAQLLLAQWRPLHAPPGTGGGDDPTRELSVLGRARALADTLESIHSLGHRD